MLQCFCGYPSEVCWEVSDLPVRSPRLSALAPWFARWQCHGTTHFCGCAAMEIIGLLLPPVHPDGFLGRASGGDKTKPEGAATSIPHCSVQISFILHVLIHHMLSPTPVLYIDTSPLRLLCCHCCILCLVCSKTKIICMLCLFARADLQ